LEDRLGLKTVLFLLIKGTTFARVAFLIFIGVTLQSELKTKQKGTFKR